MGYLKVWFIGDYCLANASSEAMSIKDNLVKKLHASFAESNKHKMK